MRDRLIQLICEGMADRCGSECKIPNKEYCRQCFDIADYLIENGVIVPPCKVGTELHFLWDRTRYGFPVQILSTDDWQICTDIDGTYIDCKDIPISFKGTSRYVLGKTVFLTKEEAEQALKECEG